MSPISEEAKRRMLDATRRRAQEEEYGNSGTQYNLPEGKKFWKLPKAGFDYTKEFDNLPYPITDPLHPEVRAGRLQVGDLVDTRKVHVHGYLGPEENSYLCLHTWGKPCPCELSGDRYKPKERELRNIFDLGEQEKGVQFWDISVFCFSTLLNKEIKSDNDNPRPGRTPFAFHWWPEDGYTLQVRFEKGIAPNVPAFPKAGRIDFLKREPYAENDPLLAEVVNIDDILKVPDYEHLARLMGVSSTSTTSAPQTQQQTPQTTRRAVPQTQQAEQTRQRGQHAIDPDQDCPSGHRFGVDTDNKPECVSCADDRFNACRTAKDAASDAQATQTRTQRAAPVANARAAEVPTSVGTTDGLAPSTTPRQRRR